MVLLLALALAAAGCAGIALAPLLAHKRALYALGVAFAAGTLLTLTLVHVLPETMAQTRAAAPLFVAGFVMMMLMQQHVLEADPCCGHEHARHAVVPSYLAMILCSFKDGILVSSDIGRGFGSTLLWAMMLHQATASFALVMLLREVAGLQGWIKRMLPLALFVLVTPVVLLLAVEMAQLTPYMPWVLALSGGALLYVIAANLVPRVEHVAREKRGPVLAAFLAAVLVNVGLELLEPDHGHGPASLLHAQDR